MSPFMHPFEHTYDDYVALAKRLRRDGTPVALEDARPGDFCYVSDGPRVIVGIDEHGHLLLPDVGGPITGGVLSSGRQVFRGGTDHVLARADFQASRLERRKRERGTRHG